MTPTETIHTFRQALATASTLSEIDAAQDAAWLALGRYAATENTIVGVEASLRRLELKRGREKEA